MKRASPELSLQKSVLAYLKLALPASAFVTAFPSEGGAGGFRRGQRMKASGLVKGVPDLLIAHKGRCLWLELKAHGRKCTPDQLACHARLFDSGCSVFVCYTIEDVEGALVDIGIVPRVRLGIRRGRFTCTLALFAGVEA